MKILLATFSDNADHQDIVVGLFEQLQTQADVWLIITRHPKVIIPNSLRIKQVKCPKRPGVCRQTFDFQSLFAILKWVRQQHFDAIFFETLHVWNLLIMLFCRKECRILQMIHDLIPHKGDRAERAVFLTNKIVCKLSTDIILPNQKYKNVAIEIFGVSPQHVKCIDLWRRFPSYTPPTFTKKVLFFGRINPYKGLDSLLNIIRNCPEIEFHVIGKVDSSIASLAQQIALEKNVISNFGYVSNQEMAAAFINADWVILPYKSATQSGVIMDAYRYSRPVIAFDVGAISEQVCEGISGFLIPDSNWETFSQTLKKVMRLSNKDYEAFCKQSYEFGLQKYGAKGATSRFLKLLES